MPLSRKKMFMCKVFLLGPVPLFKNLGMTYLLLDVSTVFCNGCHSSLGSYFLKSAEGVVFIMILL